jgi:hypothetical protein
MQGLKKKREKLLLIKQIHCTVLVYFIFNFYYYLMFTFEAETGNVTFCTGLNCFFRAEQRFPKSFHRNKFRRNFDRN